MGFQEQTVQFSEYIQQLTGVHCALMNLEQKSFVRAPFRSSCRLKDGCCTAAEMHCTCCKKAARWSGQYRYHCPRGYHFIATSLHPAGYAEEYGMIIGPFLLDEPGKIRKDTSLEQGNPEDIPLFTREKARSLGEVVRAMYGYLTGGQMMVAIDEEALRTMIAVAQPDDLPTSYPIDEERRLQQLIRSGNKKEAQQSLNILMLELYMTSGNDLQALKRRFRELITLMSRAAADSGADVNAVLSLCDRSVAEIDQLTDFDALDVWLGNMLHRFFDLVFDFNDAKHQNIIRQVSSYIQEHLSEKLTLEQVAGEVHLSKSYLCRILKEELGCTFTEYANRLRIERSKTYLHRSAMPLSEIACAVGFDDQSYFTRIFKRVVGMPPGKYRANNLSA